MTKAEAAMKTLTMTYQSMAQLVEPAPPLLRLIAELEDRLTMVTAWTNADESSIIATIEAMSWCHCALQDVLQHVIEMGDGEELNVDEAINPDVVIGWCIGVKCALDRSFVTLLPATAGTLR